MFKSMSFSIVSIFKSLRRLCIFSIYKMFKVFQSHKLGLPIGLSISLRFQI
jgi:hypothetical protein